ncbi:hypothetical protein [Streptomyces zagrosensis]|uniref:Uncharacterized protein n=1 Tax=Streptomyces zagrosensis TaxID=1042984 RepID=A0A7W9QA67_9ACTN|nr:hypothetical protein [Streptomyces zagrosensis]MBB5936476.1 hypothetical protein [Streptomyces zagrosensis]
MNTPTEFKQLLASELSVMAAEAAPDQAPSAPTRRRRAPLAIAAVATAAAAAVIVPTVSGSGSTPAYAVTEQDDGSVILDLRRAEGLPGLQRELKKLHLPAVALEGDENCSKGHPGIGTYATAFAVMKYPSAPGKARIYPDVIPKGTWVGGKYYPPATLLLVAEFKDNGKVKGLSDWLVTDVPSCSKPGYPDRG